MFLYYLSITANIYTFFDFGIMSMDLHKILLGISETFRLVKFMCLFWFFIHRSAGMYECKYMTRRLVYSIIVFFLVVFIGLGILFLVGSYNYFHGHLDKFTIESHKYCLSYPFLLMRFLPFLFSLVFFVVFRRIKKRIEADRMDL